MAGPVMAELRVLRTRDELLATVGAADAFGRFDPPEQLSAGYAVGSAVAYLRRAHAGRSTLSVWGADLTGLLDALAAAGILGDLVPGWISVPRDRVHDLTHRAVVRGGGDWDWLWTEAAPPAVPHEGRLVTLDDTADAEEIGALLAQNPRSEGYPGTGRSALWLGIRDASGGLLACGAVHRLESGVAHLAGIHAAERVRGQGFGRAVTAGLTRWAVDREGVCTLGMYADSARARGVYESLGYRIDKQWSSRILFGVRS